MNVRNGERISATIQKRKKKEEKKSTREKEGDYRTKLCIFCEKEEKKNCN